MASVDANEDDEHNEAKNGDNQNDNDTDTTVDEPTREELLEQVVGLIHDTIGRQNEWQAYGGERSSIRELNGNLIIKTTVQNHQAIRKLLKSLRPNSDEDEALWPGLDQNPEAYSTGRTYLPTQGVGEITGDAP